MATYFVSSAGSNTSPYDTWAKAATSVQTALTAANSGTDVVVIDKAAIPTGDAEAAGNVTYTTANHVSIISATNDGGSDYTPSAMGASVWLGNSTTARNIVLDGGSDDKIYLYGITIRTASTGVIRITNSAGGVQIVGDDCYLWSGTSSINLSMNYNHVVLNNPTIRFGGTGSGIGLQGRVEINGGSVSSAGSVPTNMISTSSSGGSLIWTGGDLSFATGTLVGSLAYFVSVTFDRCLMGSGYTALAAQATNPTRASANCTILDCATGDTHGIYEFHDAMGSLTLDTGIYYTGSTAGNLSWKIVTTANATATHPFVSPWISGYEAAAGPVTPRLEILRDGSTTAYDDDEVWCEAIAKVTSGSTLATRYTDGIAFGVTPTAQANGAGLGSWTGESGTAWSGKIDTGSAITFAEAGDLSMRVCVGVASSTVYVNPVPLTA